MRQILIPTILALGLGAAFLPASAEAAGCLKGAAIGGVAGHVAGHHAVLGAAAGCAIGHHEAAVSARRQSAQQGSDGSEASPNR